MTRHRVAVRFAIAAGATLGCRPSDILSVPAPSGVVSTTSVDNQTGAESIFNAARFAAFDGLVGVPGVAGEAAGGGVLEWSSLLADEFIWATWRFDNYQGNIDFRLTTGTIFSTGGALGFRESGDEGVESLLAADRALVFSVSGLRQYEPAAGRSKVGEAFALAAYAELLMAEDYCAGVPLGQILPTGGFQYGTPLTTDSLLGSAEAKFDSALANAHGDPTVRSLATVGLARTRLDRGHPDAAASTVGAVPTSFVYNAELPPTYGDGGVKTTTVYGYLLGYQSIVGPFFYGPYNATFVNMADRKGQNGLDFVSAGDPRLVVDSALGTTPDGTTLRFPKKFETNPGNVPLATGVEARLIEAEAALAKGDVATWTTDLNDLRADAANTNVSGLQPLTADSTTTATAAMRVDVMFRERAFWLYGTGTRLGDLRRLIRQYGRAANTVFPSGPYVIDVPPTGLSQPLPPANYGSDVSLTLPTAGATQVGYTTGNPHYKGCLNANP